MIRRTIIIVLSCFAISFVGLAGASWNADLSWMSPPWGDRLFIIAAYDSILTVRLVGPREDSTVGDVRKMLHSYRSLNLHPYRSSWHGFLAHHPRSRIGLQAKNWITYGVDDSETHYRILSAKAPLLLLSAACMAYPAFPIVSGFRRWHRVRHGRCPSCGYNLTGNVSGVCPECGEVA